MEEREVQSDRDHHGDQSSPIRKAFAKVQISDWIASIAALTAVVSLVIAVMGYRLAQEQTALSRDQFEQSRAFWWLSSVDEDLVLTLIPSRSDVVVESVQVVFPKSLFREGGDWVLKPKNLKLSLQDIHSRLMAIRASDLTFDKATGRYNVHARPHQLPLVVESRHMVGGTMYSDRTIFFIRLRTKFTLGPQGDGYIKLERVALSDAFLYGRLVHDEDDTDETLSKYWDIPHQQVVVAQVAPIGGRVTMEGPFPSRGNAGSPK